MRRPRIAIPGRFAAHADGLRNAGVVLSRNLMEYVWAGGGEPLVLLPVTGEGMDWEARLADFDGLLLPGGGDVNPCHYEGHHLHPSLDRVDDLQDEADLGVVRHAIAVGMPVLAICRGAQVLNVALGGSLVEDMATPHWREHRTIALAAAAEPLGMGAGSVDVFCSHHQAIARLAPNLTAVAHAGDGTLEAVVGDTAAWTAGVQWHPEDTFRDDDRQVALMRRFVAACG